MALEEAVNVEKSEESEPLAGEASSLESAPVEEVKAEAKEEIPTPFSKLKSAFVERFKGDEIVEIEPLSGQASNRLYFRIFSKKEKTFILMQLPEAAPSSEEATNATPDVKPRELPFIEVGGYLGKIGIPVPAIYFHLKEEGQILLEDVGDRNLETLLFGAPDEFILFYYKKAIETLILFQEKTASSKNQPNIAFERAFNFDLLYAECEHFLEYGAESYFKMKIEPSLRSSLEEDLKRLCREIEALPTVLVHRDFQSRNLHLHRYRMTCIDFQDALMGSVVYDLVALLRDSYISLAPAIVAELKGFYWNGISKSRKVIPPGFTREKFERAFHLQTVQRKLKDAGRFQYISVVKKNDRFLPYRIPSLSYVKEALAQLPDYHALAENLSPWMV